MIYAHGAFILESPRLVEFARRFMLDGVTIFFVLSGFLIGRIVIRDFGSGLANYRKVLSFWKRRWFRTLPAFYLVLLIYALVYDPRKIVLLQFSIFSQNLLDHNPPFFREAWSISIEEWFYLGLPIALVFSLSLWRNLRRSLLAVIVLFGLMGPLMRMGQFQLHDPALPEFWELYIRCMVLCRLDSLALGVFAAYLSHYHAALWHAAKRLKFLIGLVVLVFPLLLDGWVSSIKFAPTVFPAMIYFSLEPMATFLMLPLLSTYRREPDGFTLVVTHVSVISYAMYLLNLGLVRLKIIPWIQSRFMPDERGLGWQFLSVALFVVITLVLSTWLYRYYEAPCTRLRDRWKFPWEK